MKKNSIIFYAAALLVIFETGCVKVIDKFNSNNLTVTFNAPTAMYLTGDKIVNGKDSLDFSYSGTCTQTITYVALTKNDTELGRDSIKSGDRMSFSNLVKKFVADTIPGNYVYKVVARDNQGVYLGSSKPIVVTVTADFMYYTNLRLYVPDTIAKTNPTYFNFATVKAFSYSTALANLPTNGSKIDIGYYYDTDSVKISSKNTAKGHTIYNLAVTPVPSNLSIYNTSTFTQNVTQFKRITSPTWANLNSAGILKTTARTNLTGTLPNSIDLALNDAKTAVQAPAGSVIIFKTAEGKIGVMQVTFVSQENATHSTYMNFEVKMVN